MYCQGGVRQAVVKCMKEAATNRRTLLVMFVVNKSFASHSLQTPSNARQLFMPLAAPHRVARSLILQRLPLCYIV